MPDVGMAQEGPIYLYLGPSLGAGTALKEVDLTGMPERHRISLPTGELHALSDVFAEAQRVNAKGIVAAASTGWVGRGHLALARQARKRGLPFWMHWPEEEAVEQIDHGRYASHLRLWIARKCYPLLQSFEFLGIGLQFVRNPSLGLARIKAAQRGNGPSNETGWGNPQKAAAVWSVIDEAAKLSANPRPVPLDDVPVNGTSRRIAGTCVYLRLDYWAKISSGGSYGHTSYVARGFHRAADRLVCLMA